MITKLFTDEAYEKSALAHAHQANFDYLMAQPEVKHWDEKFFSQFDGKYFMGLPVNFYLRVWNMGHCYDCAEILSILFDGDCSICYGKPRYQYFTEFKHCWVEKDGLVYDTTFQITIPKNIYYRFFNLKNVKKKTPQEAHKSRSNVVWKFFTKEDLMKLGHVTCATDIFNSAANDTLNKIQEAESEEEKAVYQKIYDILPNLCKQQQDSTPIEFA